MEYRKSTSGILHLLLSITVSNWTQRVNEFLLFKANSVIVQLYHGVGHREKYNLIKMPTIILYVIQLSDRVYNVTFPAYDLYSLRRIRREYRA
jgi:hypothetical protein